MRRFDTDTEDSGKGSSTFASNSQNFTYESTPAEEADAEYYGLPLPPDGGYGWVIVGVCFLSYALVDGMTGVLGVLLPHILAEFATTRALASMPNSVLIGVLLSVGPIVGASINLFTCRSVTIAGGIIFSLSCFLSSFSPSIEIFIVLFGGLMGFGAGMIYIPISVMPGYYFERRRAIANGIACSGSGVGMLLMPIITALLLENYNWRNVLIILAGITMQIVVLGALMRPLTWIKLKEPSPVPEEEETFLVVTSTRDDDSKGYEIHRNGNEKSIFVDKRSPSVDASKEVEGRLTQSLRGLPTTTPRNNKKLLRYPTPASVNVRQSTADGAHVKRLSGEQPFNVREIKKGNEISPILASCYEFRRIPAIAEKELPKKDHKVDRTRLRYELLQPFARQDIFYTGSILSLKEYKSHKNMASYVTSVTSLPFYDSNVNCCGLKLSSHTVNTVKSMLRLSILLDPCFLIISLSGFTMIFGYYVPIVFMTDHTSSLGISTKAAASLIAIFGVTNSVGRVLSGALANSGWIDPLHIHVWSMVTAGVCSCLLVTVCSTYMHLVFTVGIYGLTLAMFVPLTTVFIVKYIGLSKLTNAYGFFYLIKGLLGMAGPTISGAMIDTTGTFTSAYFFGGGMLAFSGLVLYLLPLANIWKKAHLRKKAEAGD